MKFQHLRQLKSRKRSKIGLALLVIGGLLVAVFLAIQFIPVQRSNPAVASAINWDLPQTEALARQACMDCHSNETIWPWYAYVAPVSWLVYYDVQRGHSELNFSTLAAGGTQTGQAQFGRPGETAAANDLAYQLGQILAGGNQRGGPAGFDGGQPGSQGGSGEFPNFQATPGQFPGGTQGQPPQNGGFDRAGFGGGLANRLGEMLNSGQMPPANYQFIHSTARLTEEQRQQLLQGLLATFGLTSSAGQSSTSTN